MSLISLYLARAQSLLVRSAIATLDGKSQTPLRAAFRLGAFPGDLAVLRFMSCGAGRSGRGDGQQKRTAA